MHTPSAGISAFLQTVTRSAPVTRCKCGKQIGYGTRLCRWCERREARAIGSRVAHSLGEISTTDEPLADMKPDYHRDEETREKWRQAQRGRTRSANAKAKASATLRQGRAERQHVTPVEDGANRLCPGQPVLATVKECFDRGQTWGRAARQLGVCSQTLSAWATVRGAQIVRTYSKLGVHKTLLWSEEGSVSRRSAA